MKTMGRLLIAAGIFLLVFALVFNASLPVSIETLRKERETSRKELEEAREELATQDERLKTMTLEEINASTENSKKKLKELKTELEVLQNKQKLHAYKKIFLIIIGCLLNVAGFLIIRFTNRSENK